MCNPDKDMVPSYSSLRVPQPGYHFVKSVIKTPINERPILLTMMKAFMENLKLFSLNHCAQSCGTYFQQLMSSESKSHWPLKAIRYIKHEIMHDWLLPWQILLDGANIEINEAAHEN